MLKIYSSHTLKPKESKSRGLPIAQVVRKRGGKEVPIKTIYLKTEEYAGDAENDDSEDEDGDEEDESFYADYPKDKAFGDSFYKEVRNISPYNVELLRMAIRKKEPEILRRARPATQFDYMVERYTTATSQVDTDKKNKLFTIGEGNKDTYIKFIPPIPTVRLSVLGPSGVGKSFWINELLATYEKMNPNASEYLWGFFDDDPAYSKRSKMQNMKVDDSVIKHPPVPEEFDECIHIFDDIESLPKEVCEIVSRFRDTIFMAGRKHGQSAIAVSHEILGGFSTKAILNESPIVVLFPHCNQEPIKKLLLKKYNFSKEEVEWILSRPNRYVIIHRSHPRYLMTSTEIRVL
jgi:hypothetical protein